MVKGNDAEKDKYFFDIRTIMTGETQVRAEKNENENS